MSGRAPFTIALGVVSIVAIFSLVQCAPAQAPAPVSPTSVGQTATSAKPVGTPAKAATPKDTSDARTILTESVRLLNQTDSYQFAVSATAFTPFESKIREWRYSGNGAAAKPDKIQWSLEGQADVVFNVVSAGGKLHCADSRGENKDCSLAFGGPKPGSSPYTVIGYLKNFDSVGPLASKTVGGKEYYYITFSPSLTKMSSIDSAHSKATASVAAVNGEVLIDKSSKLPYQEKVTVKYQPQAGGGETVEMTITFARYNAPVDIKMPR